VLGSPSYLFDFDTDKLLAALICSFSVTFRVDKCDSCTSYTLVDVCSSYIVHIDSHGIGMLASTPMAVGVSHDDPTQPLR
jgi:hypothetical protein